MRVAGAAVARVAHRTFLGVEPQGEALEIRLHVLRVADGDLPAVALDDRAGVNLGDARRRPLARQLPAARLEHIEAAAMLDARTDVGTVDAVGAKQLLGHARQGRRSVDVADRESDRRPDPSAGAPDARSPCSGRSGGG